MPNHLKLPPAIPNAMTELCYQNTLGIERPAEKLNPEHYNANALEASARKTEL